MNQFSVIIKAEDSSIKYNLKGEWQDLHKLGVLNLKTCK